MAKLISPNARRMKLRYIMIERFAACSPAVLAVSPCFIPSAQAEQVLRGHVPAASVRAQELGGLPANKRLSLAIGLPLRNSPALTTLLEQLYDPASPRY